MNISVPRYMIVGLGGVFAGYLLVLAASSLDIGTSPLMVVVAMALFAAAATVSLLRLPRRGVRIVAVANLLVAVALPLLVTTQLPAGYVLGGDYATWYVAAIGALMVFVSARGFNWIAWIGIGWLFAHTLLWAGFGAFGALGVFGSALWVAVSHMLQVSLANAARDARAYSVAEREAAEWQAAQEAHLFERHFRLAKTGRTAVPMLRHIVTVGGTLTPGMRKEALYLEGAIRDEIRGRTLLDDTVREQVMVARRRGATVTLLDEGGIDELADAELARVHAAIASAIRDSSASTIIVRTVPEGSDVAVTIVGLRSSGVNLLGHADGADGADEEPEIELWMEIPRA